MLRIIDSKEDWAPLNGRMCASGDVLLGRGLVEVVLCCAVV